VIFTAPSHLSKHFKSKDKIRELEKQSLVVYNIRCSEYDADFIRKTARIFQYRMNEHSYSTSMSLNLKELKRDFFLFLLEVFQGKKARVSITDSDVTQNIISESELHIYR